ncbi:hypothetical protein NLU13_5378 [Sarocladium strictum]|uniref:Uncharacterized protein n=1 Tax=Sarocladium strictum TaxID=5046 RepID=A0AA39L7R2_SARSR|nr:hypothetical protein NLU13_5378 [Sarocladium strictum]
MGLFSKSKRQESKPPMDNVSDHGIVSSEKGASEPTVIETPLPAGARTPDEPCAHSVQGSRMSNMTLTGTYAESQARGSVTAASSSQPTSILCRDDPVQVETAKKRNCIRQFGHYINSRVCIKSIWEIISPVDYFWPITLRRYACLALIGAACVGIYFSNLYTDWIGKSMAITRTFMLPILIIVMCLEPIMFLCILAASRMPPVVENLEAPTRNQTGPLHKNKLVDEESSSSVSPSEEDTYHTALVLPCHKSDTKALRRVFESACRTAFRPKDIFVVDNARSMHPENLEFRDWVKRQHPDINYMWSPIGSKNAAQLVGALAAKGYKYILTTDDDVCLPDNYRHPTHLLNENTRAVAFPLTATNAEGDNTLFLVSWQDCEYRTSGLSKLAESNTCGVCFPHGAGWFIDREVLIQIMETLHPTDFIAEDVNAGFCMMKIGKSIALDYNVVLATEVPLTLIGPGLNWFKQRVLSWEMGRHKMLFTLLRRVFSNNGQTTLTGVIAQKAFLLYNITTLVVDWIRVPVFVTMGYSAQFWIKVALFSLISIVPLILYNYVKCWSRPTYRVRLVAALTYPIYKQLYVLVSVLGFIRAVLFYMGGYVRAKPVYKMLKDGDQECFWLDPRFETNPAWLADEREDQLIAEGLMPPRNGRSSWNMNKMEKRVSDVSSVAKAAPKAVFVHEVAQPSPVLTRARSF